MDTLDKLEELKTKWLKHKKLDNDEIVWLMIELYSTKAKLNFNEKLFEVITKEEKMECEHNFKQKPPVDGVTEMRELTCVKCGFERVTSLSNIVTERLNIYGWVPWE
jgi:hypothetical protein